MCICAFLAAGVVSAVMAAPHLTTQLETLGYGPGGDNGTCVEPSEQFARARK